MSDARQRYPPLWTIYNRPLDYPAKVVVTRVVRRDSGR